MNPLPFTLTPEQFRAWLAVQVFVAMTREQFAANLAVANDAAEIALRLIERTR